MDFADLEMANCLEQNRSIKLMDLFSNTINWARVESILLSHYPWAPVHTGPAMGPLEHSGLTFIAGFRLYLFKKNPPKIIRP